MTEPFENSQNAEDLDLLMAIAILCGHRDVRMNMRPVYELWARCYPDDALGGIGLGLSMIGEGRPREGYQLIEETARTATTRADQARDVLETLQHNMRELVS